MSIDASAGKTQEQIDRYNQRKSAFYAQTPAENRARLESKFTNQELIDELSFTQEAMILRGPS